MCTGEPPPLRRMLHAHLQRIRDGARPWIRCEVANRATELVVAHLCFAAAPFTTPLLGAPVARLATVSSAMPPFAANARSIVGGADRGRGVKVLLGIGGVLQQVAAQGNEVVIDPRMHQVSRQGRLQRQLSRYAQTTPETHTESLLRA